LNKIVVGVLAGRGESDEVFKVLHRLKDDKRVALIIPLFGVPPSRIKGKYLVMPEAAKNQRGLARSALIRHCAKAYPLADIIMLLDDDTEPQPGYFEFLTDMELPSLPHVFGGKLLNHDGCRSWDVCSFQNGNPVVVPYEFWNNPIWEADLYLSGPQHIFNKTGYLMAARLGYPALTYGEDTQFCHAFKKSGGQIQFLPDISAKLLHQHNPPNYPSVIGTSFT
jgi:hypothetical protein